MTRMRRARVPKAQQRQIEPYMPRNYTARQDGDDVLVEGRDESGWTLDGYVIPRLQSGMWFAREEAVADG